MDRSPLRGGPSGYPSAPSSSSLLTTQSLNIPLKDVLSRFRQQVNADCHAQGCVLGEVVAEASHQGRPPAVEDILLSLSQCDNRLVPTPGGKLRSQRLTAEEARRRCDCLTAKLAERSLALVQQLDQLVQNADMSLSTPPMCVVAGRSTAGQSQSIGSSSAAAHESSQSLSTGPASRSHSSYQSTGARSQASSQSRHLTSNEQQQQYRPDESMLPEDRPDLVDSDDEMMTDMGKLSGVMGNSCGNTANTSNNIHSASAGRPPLMPPPIIKPNESTSQNASGLLGASTPSSAPQKGEKSVSFDNFFVTMQTNQKKEMNDGKEGVQISRIPQTTTMVSFLKKVDEIPIFGRQGEAEDPLSMSAMRTPSQYHNHNHHQHHHHNHLFGTEGADTSSAGGSSNDVSGLGMSTYTGWSESGAGPSSSATGGGLDFTATRKARNELSKSTNRWVLNGRYEFLHSMGKGAQGAVWKVKDLHWRPPIPHDFFDNRHLSSASASLLMTPGLSASVCAGSNGVGAGGRLEYVAIKVVPRGKMNKRSPQGLSASLSMSGGFSKALLSPSAANQAKKMMMMSMSEHNELFVRLERSRNNTNNNARGSRLSASNNRQAMSRSNREETDEEFSSHGSSLRKSPKAGALAAPSTAAPFGEGSTLSASQRPKSAPAPPSQRSAGPPPPPSSDDRPATPTQQQQQLLPPPPNNVVDALPPPSEFATTQPGGCGLPLCTAERDSYDTQPPASPTFLRDGAAVLGLFYDDEDDEFGLPLGGADPNFGMQQGEGGRSHTDGSTVGGVSALTRTGRQESILPENLAVEILCGLSRHPNIVPLYEVIDDANCSNVFLVMPLCKPFPCSVKPNGKCTVRVVPSQVLKYARHAASALELLHVTNIVHCDVKLDNFLLYEDRLVLSDFGICQVGGAGGAIEVLGGGDGTMGYWAPECHDAGRPFALTPETDCYALGVCLFAMTFGRFPYWPKATAISWNPTAWKDVVPGVDNPETSRGVRLPKKDFSGNAAEQAAFETVKEVIRGLMCPSISKRWSAKRVLAAK